MTCVVCGMTFTIEKYSSTPRSTCGSWCHRLLCGINQLKKRPVKRVLLLPKLTPEQYHLASVRSDERNCYGPISMDDRHTESF